MRNLLQHVRRLEASSILPASSAAAGYAVTWVLIKIITLYQNTLSPDHGPLRHLYRYGYCRHSPTCSEYAKIQLKQRGAVVGSFLAMKRVLSCNPFAKISDEKWQEIAKRELS